MKIKFNTDDEFPLNKAIEICSMMWFLGLFFHENSKHYPQVFLEE